MDVCVTVSTVSVSVVVVSLVTVVCNERVDHDVANSVLVCVLDVTISWSVVVVDVT